MSGGGCSHGLGVDGRQLLDGGGGPSADELLRLLDQCDLSNSLCSTPCQSPFVVAAGDGLPAPPPRIKNQNVAFLNQMRDRLMSGQLGGSQSAGASGGPSSATND